MTPLEALRQIADKAWDTNDECRWCFQDFEDSHLSECPAAIAEVYFGHSSLKEGGFVMKHGSAA